MDTTRIAVWATIAIILGVTLVSGPLVKSVDLTREDPNRGRIVCNDSGSVDVELQQIPTESFAIAKQGYGSEVYGLKAEPLIVEATDVTGCPVVSYELRIHALGIFAFSNYYPTEDREGSVRMSFTGATFEPERIENDSYGARLTINVSGDRNRTLHSTNLTIPVVD